MAVQSFVGLAWMVPENIRRLLNAQKPSLNRVNPEFSHSSITLRSFSFLVCKNFFYHKDPWFQWTMLNFQSTVQLSEICKWHPVLMGCVLYNNSSIVKSLLHGFIAMWLAFEAGRAQWRRCNQGDEVGGSNERCLQPSNYDAKTVHRVKQSSLLIATL